MAELSVDKWLLDWVTVGDEKVCPQCRERGHREPQTLGQWETSGLPGAGFTYCKFKCRCILLPKDLLDVFPTLRGKTIKLRDDENLKISKEIDYKLYKELDDLVGEWEAVTNDFNLPKEYYKILDVQKRIKFLKRVIHNYGKTPPTPPISPRPVPKPKPRSKPVPISTIHKDKK